MAGGRLHRVLCSSRSAARVFQTRRLGVSAECQEKHDHSLRILPLTGQSSYQYLHFNQDLLESWLS